MSINSKFKLNNDFISFDTDDDNTNNISFTPFEPPSSSSSSSKPNNTFNTRITSFTKPSSSSQQKHLKHPPQLISSLTGVFYIPIYQPQQNSYSLIQKQITYNNDLISNNIDITSLYYKSTILNLFNLIEQHSNNNSIIDKYTTILNEYIIHLNNNITSIKNKECKGVEKDLNELMIQRFQEEIFTFELIKILFLKPRYILKERDVTLYARKHLTELLIKHLNTKCKDVLVRTFNVNDKIKQCIIHGQVQSAIELAKQNNFAYVALMLSNLNYSHNYYQQQQQDSNDNKDIKTTSTHSIPNYDIYKLFEHNNNNNNNSDNSNNDDAYNDNVIYMKSMTWKNVLIQLLIFTFEQNVPLHKILKVFKTYCDVHNVFTKEQYKTDINFQLLMLYSSIENEDLDEHREMIKLISSSYNVFNNIHNNKNNNNNNFDHHIQYLISLILIEIYNQTYNQAKKLWDSNLLRDIHLKLLNKFIEECLTIKEKNIITAISNFIEHLPITSELKRNIKLYITLNNTNNI